MRANILSCLLVFVNLVACSTPGGENIIPSLSASSAPSLAHPPGSSPTPIQEIQDSLSGGPASPTVSIPPNTPTATLVTSATSPTPHSSPDLMADSASKVCSPLAEHSLNQLPEIISQPYEPPPPGKDERHHGVDFAYYRHAGRASIEGEDVHSIMAGRVAAAIHDRLPYGNMVIIETPYEKLPDHVLDIVDIPMGSSLYHLYAHLSENPLVELSTEVACGELLGHVGKTGYVVPVAHLHLETRVGPPSARFESMVFFDSQATPDEQAAYILWRISGEFQHFDPMTILSSLNETSP